MLRRLLIAIVAAATVAHHAAAQTTRIVRLTTPDEVGIVAAYYPPKSDNAPAIVLIHSLGRNRDEWTAFATLLQQNGIAALALDLRGHGESTRRLTARGPQLVDLQSFTPRDFQDMLLDINTAADWLLEQPGIDKRRLAIAGSSIGANLALRYASFNEDVSALLLLSPGIVYRGIRTDDAVGKIGPLALRIVVSRHDAFSFESSKRLIELRKQAGAATDEKELTICTGNLHGADMLQGVRNLPQILLDWLKQSLAGGDVEASPAR